MPVDGGEGIGPSEHGGDRIARISLRRSSENYISPSGKYPLIFNTII